MSVTPSLAASPWPLTRKRVYILPTRHGVTFAAVLAVMLLGATNYNNALAFALTFALAGLALVSMLHTYRNLAGLSVQARSEHAVFAGERAAFTVVVDNRDGPRRFGVVVRPGGRDDAPPPVLEIEPGRLVEVRIELPARQRGWLAPGRILLASRAPLGLFRAWAWVPTRARCLVYPRPEGAQPLPERTVVAAEAGARRAPGEDDFAGLRPYRPGDSPRRIHWRLAARGEPLAVKQFDTAGGGERLLRYADVEVPHAEARLGQLSAWVLAAERAGLAYGLELPGARLPAARGAGHRDRCLRALALHGLDGAAARP